VDSSEEKIMASIRGYHVRVLSGYTKNKPFRLYFLYSTSNNWQEKQQLEVQGEKNEKENGWCFSFG
jgi:hypothetical protein